VFKLPALPKGRELMYAISAAVCLCVSLTLIAVMAFSGAKRAGTPNAERAPGASASPAAASPASQASESPTPVPEIRIDGQTLTALFSLYMTEELPVRDIEAQVLDGVIRVEAAIDKEKLTAYLERMQAPSYLTALAALVPDGTSAGADFAVKGEDGLTLTLEALSVDGMEINRAILPDSVFQSVDSAMGQLLDGLNTRVGSARTENGELVLTPRS